MSKVILFKKTPSPEVVKMLNIGSIIDEAIIEALKMDMEPSDILGLLAHRMGVLLKATPDLDLEFL